MNPILIILILLAGCLLWLICAFMFKPLGKLFSRLWNDAEEAINFEETKNNKKE